MTSPPVNTKTFSLINKISETFSLRISNFAFATTLLFRIRDKINLVILPSFKISPLMVFNLRRIRLITGVVKLIANITQTINVKKVRLVLSIREILSNTITIYGKVPLSIVSKAIQKATSTILIKKITLTIDPVIATFFILGDFDPEILGDLDPLTLGEMDYT